MTLKELIEKERLKTIDQIKENVRFVNGSKFLSIKVNNIEEHKKICSNLENFGISREISYSDCNQGFIWLRWNAIDNKFKTYLNYNTDGVDYYKNNLYNSSDITTIGEFLIMRKSKNEVKDSKKKRKN